jgi:hypothetical protein
VPTGFATQATVADVRNQAAVMLIDGTNAVVSAGTTDAAGTFTLYKSTQTFAPATGDIFTLDIFKRTADGQVLSLRTFVQKTASGWTSVTGPTIVVNLTTTAVCQIVAEDAAIVPADAINTVSGAPTYTTIAAIGSRMPAEIAQIATTMATGLGLDQDPVNQAGYEHVGDVTITSAADVETLRHVGRIVGKLTIDSPTLTALDLPRLGEVTGDLQVNSPSLQTLALPRLRMVGRHLQIGHADYGMYSPSLATIRVPALQVIQGRLYVSGCDSLADLSWARQIQSVGNGVYVGDTPLIANLEGLPGQTTLENLELRNLPALTSFNGLKEGTRLTRGLFLQNLPQIASLTMLPTLGHLGESVWLSGMGGLQDLQGMPSGWLTYVRVYDNPNLTSLQGLASATYLDLFNLPALQTLGSIYGYRQINISGDFGVADFTSGSIAADIQNLMITNAPNITSLNGLGTIKALNALNLSGNPNLTSISGLSGLQHVQGLTIWDNATLPTAAVTTFLGQLNPQVSPQIGHNNG